MRSTATDRARWGQGDTVLVVAGVVGGSVLDLFVQFLFQLFVVLFCAPDVPILGRVHGLPGHLCAAGKEDAAGGKPDMTMRMSKRKTPTITRTCALLLAAFASPFKAVRRQFYLFLRLVPRRTGSRCAIGCRFAACGLRRRARTGGGIVAFVDFLPLFPA